MDTPTMFRIMMMAMALVALNSIADDSKVEEAVILENIQRIEEEIVNLNDRGEGVSVGEPKRHMLAVQRKVLTLESKIARSSLVYLLLQKSEEKPGVAKIEHGSLVLIDRNVTNREIGQPSVSVIGIDVEPVVCQLQESYFVRSGGKVSEVEQKAHLAWLHSGAWKGVDISHEAPRLVLLFSDGRAEAMTWSRIGVAIEKHNALARETGGPIVAKEAIEKLFLRSSVGDHVTIEELLVDRSLKSAQEDALSEDGKPDLLDLLRLNRKKMQALFDEYFPLGEDPNALPGYKFRYEVRKHQIERDICRIELQIIFQEIANYRRENAGKSPTEFDQLKFPELIEIKRYVFVNGGGFDIDGGRLIQVYRLDPLSIGELNRFTIEERNKISVVSYDEFIEIRRRDPVCQMRPEMLKFSAEVPVLFCDGTVLGVKAIHGEDLIKGDREVRAANGLPRYNYTPLEDVFDRIDSRIYEGSEENSLLVRPIVD